MSRSRIISDTLCAMLAGVSEYGAIWHCPSLP